MSEAMEPEVSSLSPKSIQSLVAMSKLDAIVEKIKEGIDKKVECWAGVQRSGDWAIVQTVDEGKNEDNDYYNERVYHLPSWTPGCDPVMKSNWRKEGWMRPTGRGFRFGKPGEIEIIDKTRDELVETHELAKLC